MKIALKVIFQIKLRKCAGAILRIVLMDGGMILTIVVQLYAQVQNLGIALEITQHIYVQLGVVLNHMLTIILEQGFVFKYVQEATVRSEYQQLGALIVLETIAHNLACFTVFLL